MERYDSSLRFLYLYCRGLSRIRHIALILSNVQVLWVYHVYQIYIFLDLADCQIQVFWVCHVWQTQVFLNLTDYQV
jgi:hypothetical protein